MTIGLLVERARRQGDRIALVDGGLEWTYRELADFVDRIATFLAADGVGRGTVVGLLGTNSAGYVATVLALYALGAVALPLNFRLADAELRWQLEQVGAAFVFAETAMLDRDLGKQPVLPLPIEAGGLTTAPRQPRSSLVPSGLVTAPPAPVHRRSGFDTRRAGATSQARPASALNAIVGPIAARRSRKRATAPSGVNWPTLTLRVAKP